MEGTHKRADVEALMVGYRIAMGDRIKLWLQHLDQFNRLDAKLGQDLL